MDRCLALKGTSIALLETELAVQVGQKYAVLATSCAAISVVLKLETYGLEARLGPSMSASLNPSPAFLSWFESPAVVPFPR